MDHLLHVMLVLPSAGFHPFSAVGTMRITSNSSFPVVVKAKIEVEVNFKVKVKTNVKVKVQVKVTMKVKAERVS